MRTDWYSVVFVVVTHSSVAWWLGVGVLVVVLGAVCLTVVARVVVVDVGLGVGSAATAREAFEEDHCSMEKMRKAGRERSRKDFGAGRSLFYQ